MVAREEAGLPFPSPADLPNPGIEPGSPTLQVDSLPSEPPRSPRVYRVVVGWRGGGTEYIHTLISIYVCVCICIFALFDML